MIIQALCFYLFSAVMIAAAVMVISARNPVHSVLFLILAFLNAAALFVLMGAEFLAMILAIVYVGAVAVLFMYVVMMLDIDFTQLREGFLEYLPIGAAIGLVLLVELGFAVAAWRLSDGAALAAAAPAAEALTNTEALGHVLYTKYFYLFQAAGVILLIAMVGAIVLTLRHREGVRRQRIARQVERRRDEAVKVRKVTPGSGI
jgi:NADH-quinone oxidoreductase subunit J